MAAAILALVTTTITSADTITLRTLLREMVSAEENAMLPEVPYRCLQESSHDRRSVSPGAPGWFANEDGYGIIRTDTVQGRREQVLLDCHAPGVITRFWLTTLRKDGTLRFYFDGETEASLTLPAYDLSLMPVPDIIGSLVMRHTSYTPTGKGGETMFLPLPFAKGCKVTWEDAPGVAPSLAALPHLVAGTVGAAAHLLRGAALLLGIVPDKLPGSDNYRMGWAHNYSLPREISIDTAGNICQRPYIGLKSLRTATTVSWSACASAPRDFVRQTPHAPRDAGKDSCPPMERRRSRSADTPISAGTPH